MTFCLNTVDIHSISEGNKMDEIEARIRQILPSISSETVTAVLEKLENYLVVTSVADLRFVERQDLEGLLTPIQIRKLLEGWKNVEENDLAGKNFPSPFEITASFT